MSFISLAVILVLAPPCSAGDVATEVNNDKTTVSIPAKDTASTPDEINRMIRWLVPADGRVNGIAFRTLTRIGLSAGPAITQHAFVDPIVFFQGEMSSQERSKYSPDKWLPGTQTNAASALAEIGYVKALPELKAARIKGGPDWYLKSISESIRILEKKKRGGR